MEKVKRFILVPENIWKNTNKQQQPSNKQKQREVTCDQNISKPITKNIINKQLNRKDAVLFNYLPQTDGVTYAQEPAPPPPSLDSLELVNTLEKAKLIRFKTNKLVDKDGHVYTNVTREYLVDFLESDKRYIFKNNPNLAKSKKLFMKALAKANIETDKIKNLSIRKAVIAEKECQQGKRTQTGSGKPKGKKIKIPRKTMAKTTIWLTI